MIEIINLRAGNTPDTYIVNGWINVDSTHPDWQLVLDWVAAGKEVMPQYTAEELVIIQKMEEDRIRNNFKSLYLSIVDAKLRLLDYDSLATVKLWEGDATFGSEATRILNWYKAIITLNYSILTDVLSGARAIPTDAEYLAEINGVIF